MPQDSFGEVHEETGHFHHTALVIHDNKAAGTDHGADSFEESNPGAYPVIFGSADAQTAAGGTADLNGFEIAALTPPPISK